MSNRKIPKKKTKDLLINFKVTEEQMKSIKEIADKFADGNVSELARFAILNFKGI